MKSGASFSPDRAYRYTLWRQWGDSKFVAFIGLNPSTADETLDDPTIRRCLGFAKAWGFGGLLMLNIFALRSTDPRQLLKVEDPIGPENNDRLQRGVTVSELVVAAWGVHGVVGNRGRDVIELLADQTTLMCLGRTKDGYPKHPLYLPSSAELVAL